MFTATYKLGVDVFKFPCYPNPIGFRRKRLYNISMFHDTSERRGMKQLVYPAQNGSTKTNSPLLLIRILSP